MKIIKINLYKDPKLFQNHPELKLIKDIIEVDICKPNKDKKKNASNLIKKFCSRSKKPKNQKNFIFNKSYTFAYFSGWGTGKTSRIVNLLEDYLSIKPIIISAWKFAKITNDPLQLNNFVINEIIGSMVNYADNKIINEKQSHSIQNETKTNVGLRVPAIAEMGIEGALRGYKTSTLEIPKGVAEKMWLLNQQIKLHLEKTQDGKPIVIIFDDLDRLDENLIKPMLDTIRNFTEIKGLIFIVPIDDSKLINALKKNNKYSKNKNSKMDLTKKYSDFINKYFDYIVKASNNPVIDHEIILKSLNIPDFIMWNELKPILSSQIKNFTYRTAIDVLNRLAFNLTAINVRKEEKETKKDLFEKQKIMLLATLIQTYYPLIYTEISDSIHGYSFAKSLFEESEFPLKNPSNIDVVPKELIGEWNNVRTKIIKTEYYENIKLKDKVKLLWQYVNLFSEKGKVLEAHKTYMEIITKFENKDYLDINIVDLPKLFEHDFIKNGARDLQITFAENVLIHFADRIEDKKFLKLLWKRAPLQKVEKYNRRVKIINNTQANINQALTKFGNRFFLEIIKNNNLDLDDIDIENIQNLKDEIKEVSCYHLRWLLENFSNISTTNLTLHIWKLEDFKTLCIYFEEKEINPSFKDFDLEQKLLKKHNTLFSSILLSRYENNLYQFALDLITKILQDIKFNVDVQQKLLKIENFDYNAFHQLPNDIRIKLFKEATKFKKFMDLKNNKTIFEIIEFNENFSKKDAQQFLIDENRLVLLDECISEIEIIPSKLIKNWNDFSFIKKSYIEKFDDDIFKNMIKILDENTTVEDEDNLLELAKQRGKLQWLITNWSKKSLHNSAYENFELKKYIIPLKLLPLEWEQNYVEWNNDKRFKDKIQYDSFEKMKNFVNERNAEYNDLMEYTSQYIKHSHKIGKIVKFKALKNAKNKIEKLIEEGYHNWDSNKTLRQHINSWNNINNIKWKQDNNKNS